MWTVKLKKNRERKQNRPKLFQLFLVHSAKNFEKYMTIRDESEIMTNELEEEASLGRAYIL